MCPTIGTFVLPVRSPFHLGAADNSINYYTSPWPNEALGIIVQIDQSKGREFDPWITVLASNILGCCLFSEVKIIL